MKRLLLSVVLSALTCGPAYAVPMIVDYNVDFFSPIQSFWGPGQSAANFSYNQVIVGNSTLGVRIEA